MSDHLGTSGVFINSIVGDGTRFVGDLELNGLLRIDGDFIGNIRTNGKVLIGKNGRAECTITADTVVIGGVVKGDIVSRGKVVILSTGMLIGNVSTPRLISEDGVILNGLCMISSLEEASVSNTTVLSTNTLKGDGLEKYNPANISN
jgi:cytoskeletal protein CcmA (bactofilin family)